MCAHPHVYTCARSRRVGHRTEHLDLLPEPRVDPGLHFFLHISQIQWALGLPSGEKLCIQGPAEDQSQQDPWWEQPALPFAPPGDLDAKGNPESKLKDSVVCLKEAGLAHCTVAGHSMDQCSSRVGQNIQRCWSGQQGSMCSGKMQGACR